jgi:predicted small integral membrane protein
MSSSVSLAIAAVIVLVGGVTYIELRAAPAGRKARAAGLAAAVTTGILAALALLAIVHEWLAGPMNLP